ncbi:hypothetical protein M3629_23765 [Paenibacillus polysaccharolyticus]|uniref:acyl-CoA thioesterase n=1 Tax=Paenibacillus polysaccharolyticus TaxID=582692 RepID=UPI00203B6997|nr:thioesterase family protein [Paenibacillus polysaccharolyticus]MCM3135800.1 hypothetical protein [Paenibacillus polysaccharolyticus]
MIENNYISEIRQTIYLHDTDSGGVVYFGNMSRFIEMGFTEWFREFVAPIKSLNSNYGIFFVVKESKQKFRKSVYYDNEISIRTELKDMKFYTLTFLTEVKVKGEVHYSGETTLTPIDIHSGLPVKIPQEILNFKGK